MSLEGDKKKLFDEVAKQCEVGDFRRSNVSSMLDALCAVEQANRLEKKKQHPLLAAWDWLKKLLKFRA